MFHLKYYVFLMIGIFLALGLGILMGVTLESKDMLENQQMQIARQIEDRIILQRAETDGLKVALKASETQRNELDALTQILLKETVRNKLTGLKVALVTFKEIDLIDILDFLDTTGASIQYNICIKPTFKDYLDDNGSELATFTVLEPDGMAQAIISDVLYSITYGGMTPLIQELEDLKLISNSNQYEIPADVLILVGTGSDSKTISYETLMVNDAIKMGIPIIAVETKDTTQSAVTMFMTYGVSTVDHVDTFYGKLALASLLSGNHGNYGSSIGAKSLLPSPLFFELNEMDVVYEAGSDAD